MSNYPPGVTGNEPEISGIYPPEQVIDGALDDLREAEKKIDEVLSHLDDQGASTDEINSLGEEIVTKLVELQDVVSSRMPQEPDYDDRDQ